MDLEQLHRDYWRDGFVHGGPLIPGEQVYQLCNLFELSAGFAEVMNHPSLAELAAGEPMVKACSPQFPLLYPRDAMYNGANLRRDPLNP